MASNLRPVLWRWNKQLSRTLPAASLSVAAFNLRHTPTAPVCLRWFYVCSSSSSRSYFIRPSSASVQRIWDAQRYGFYSSLAPSTSSFNEIVVQRLDGLPVLSVPMPSRPEKCRFVLKPLANTLSDFVAFIKLEDSAVERVSAYTEDGQVLPGPTKVEILLKKNFYLHINDEQYLVKAPEPVDEMDGEPVKDLAHAKDTVARLFSALCSDQFHIGQQRRLLARLEEVKGQLEPLEKIKLELLEGATRRTRTLTWIGLGLMGLQFGFLARLTWWEYSWDIMEPVTYFVTSGTAMAMYAYHLLTIQDYSYPDAHDREVVKTIHRLSKETTFDISKYNQLRSEKARLELDLDRLRNPLEVKLNPPYLP